MKFIRRRDLTSKIRASIALEALLHRGVWGNISRLVQRYQVSRQFIYLLLWAASGLFEPKVAQVVSEPQRIELCWDRFLTALKLQGDCSIGDISQILKMLQMPKNAVGAISQRLRELACALPKERLSLDCLIVLLIDETFLGRKPILVIIDAKSHYIFRAILAPDRKADTWEALLKELKDGGMIIDYVVGDQGFGLRKGAEAAGFAHHPDLMHLVRIFGPWLWRYERIAIEAIKKEIEREKVFESAKSEANLTNRLQQYEEAVEEAEQAMRRYDNYAYLWGELIRAFDPFNADGSARTRSSVEGEIGAILELMESEFNDSKLHAAVRSFRKAVEEYWPYFERLEAIVEQLSNQMPQDVLRELSLAWQAEKKSRAAKVYSQKKALERVAAERRFLAACTNMQDTDSVAKNVFQRLDSNVRSSSPIEAINSQIRDYLNSSRGQITRETLDMIVYFLNHKVASRGAYKGTSAWERLTGEHEKGTVVDQIVQYSALRKTSASLSDESGLSANCGQTCSLNMLCPDSRRKKAA